MYEPTLVSLRADKQTRNQNQIIRKEQDEAYQKSLQEDKEKVLRNSRTFNIQTCSLFMSDSSFQCLLIIELCQIVRTNQ